MKNVVKLIASQNLPAYVTPKGVTVQAYNVVKEFSSETIQEITAENAALWAVCALRKFQREQRLQKKTGFKMSKDVHIEMSIGNKKASAAMKFSLNVDRLTAMLENSPALIAEIFTLNPGIGGLTKSKALNYITQNPAKMVLANRKDEKEIEYVEMPAGNGTSDLEVIPEA